MKHGRFAKLRAFALSLGVLGWAIAASADPKPAANWQEYRSAQGGYKIEMPGKPEEVVKDLPSAPGKKMYAATLSYNNGGMLAVASDLASDRAADPEKLLDYSRDTAMKAMNATVSNEQKEKVGNYPARRFDYSASNGFGGTMRLVVSDRLLYQINAVGPAGYAATPEAKRFLNSFALTGN